MVLKPLARTIEFVAPGQIQIVKEELPKQTSEEVTVQALYSAVSAGTELLVYNGEMPTDIPVDELFSGQSSAFSYPAQYGYAMVGMVTESSKETDLPIGTSVFAFREHTSIFRERPANLMEIPSDINPMDACFLPNMETAVSIAMDAAILPGESVCVVGQGIVGLLVVSVIRKLHPYSRVVSLDIIEERRRISEVDAGAHASLNPEEAGYLVKVCKVFDDNSGADVSIDVSGSGRGLNTAILATRNHGRVVIASWFGRNSVTLDNLGGRFHRSHIQMIASQVSCIPAALTGRWSKERRFKLVWELLKDISPSKRFPIHVASLNNAPQTYREIADGLHIQVIFAYQ